MTHEVRSPPPSFISHCAEAVGSSLCFQNLMMSSYASEVSSAKLSRVKYFENINILLTSSLWAQLISVQFK